MLLNDELELYLPEGFHELSAEEAGRLEFTEPGAGSVFSDPDRHILVSIGWKKIGALAGVLLSEKDLSKRMEKSLGDSMASFGYRAIAGLNKTLDGDTAEGIRYRYVTQGTEMEGESLVLKHKKTLYYFHFYTRTAMVAENQPVWEQILGSVRWQ